MTKKKKDTKTVIQNKRNKILNRYYKSTIKTLLKLLLAELKKKEKDFTYKTKISQTFKTYFSILDKGVKKNIIHINNAANKKSKITQILSSFFNL